MRIIMMAVVAIAVLTMPARAQVAHLPTEKEHVNKEKDEHPTTKADDRAYKSALDGIPAPKQGFDPWRNVREKPQSNSSR